MVPRSLNYYFLSTDNHFRFDAIPGLLGFEHDVRRHHGYLEYPNIVVGSVKSVNMHHSAKFVTIGQTVASIFDAHVWPPTKGIFRSLPMRKIRLELIQYFRQCRNFNSLENDIQAPEIGVLPQVYQSSPQ